MSRHRDHSHLTWAELAICFAVIAAIGLLTAWTLGAFEADRLPAAPKVLPPDNAPAASTKM